MTDEHPIERRETGRPWAREGEPPVGPDMASDPLPVTEEQLRAIWARIEKINRHFDACCAFMKDACGWGPEFDRLYDLLQLAGAPEEKTPFDRREDFEAWLASRT